MQTGDREGEHRGNDIILRKGKSYITTDTGGKDDE
jgi:hypothetical protein